MPKYVKKSDGKKGKSPLKKNNNVDKKKNIKIEATRPKKNLQDFYDIKLQPGFDDDKYVYYSNRIESVKKIDDGSIYKLFFDTIKNNIGAFGQTNTPQQYVLLADNDLSLKLTLKDGLKDPDLQLNCNWKKYDEQDYFKRYIKQKTARSSNYSTKYIFNDNKPYKWTLLTIDDFYYILTLDLPSKFKDDKILEEITCDTLQFQKYADFYFKSLLNLDLVYLSSDEQDDFKKKIATMDDQSPFEEFMYQKQNTQQDIDYNGAIQIQMKVQNSMHQSWVKKKKDEKVNIDETKFESFDPYNKHFKDEKRFKFTPGVYFKFLNEGIGDEKKFMNFINQIGKVPYGDLKNYKISDQPDVNKKDIAKFFPSFNDNSEEGKVIETYFGFCATQLEAKAPFRADFNEQLYLLHQISKILLIPNEDLRRNYMYQNNEYIDENFSNIIYAKCNEKYNTWYKNPGTGVYQIKCQNNNLINKLNQKAVPRKKDDNDNGFNCDIYNFGMSITNQYINQISSDLSQFELELGTQEKKEQQKQKKKELGLQEQVDKTEEEKKKDLLVGIIQKWFKSLKAFYLNGSSEDLKQENIDELKAFYMKVFQSKVRDGTLDQWFNNITQRCFEQDFMQLKDCDLSEVIHRKIDQLYSQILKVEYDGDSIMELSNFNYEYNQNCKYMYDKYIQLINELQDDTRREKLKKELKEFQERVNYCQGLINSHIQKMSEEKHIMFDELNEKKEQIDAVMNDPVEFKETVSIQVTQEYRSEQIQVQVQPTSSLTNITANYIAPLSLGGLILAFFF